MNITDFLVEKSNGLLKQEPEALNYGNSYSIGKNPNSLKNLKRMTSIRAKELGFGKWMKGKKLSEETKNKIKESLKVNRYVPIKGIRFSLKTEFKKGQKPWNFGTKRLSVHGENHWNWKGGITNDTKKERTKFRLHYAPKVFQRDNYTCQKCNIRGKTLQANHKKSWADFPELRFDLTNVETLCWSCHYFITFGKEPKEGSQKFGTWKI